MLCDALVIGNASPLLIALGLAIAAALFLGGLWLWHVTTLGAARREAETFKQQVMALSDKIDALRERHKLLPHLDQDYSAPMAGETQATYNQVAAQLEQHRQQWLKLMDVWEQADALLQAETMLGTRRAREARQRIKTANAPAALQALLHDCEAPLDRLEEAHAQVIARLKAFEEEQQRLTSQQQALFAASLATHFYQGPTAAAAALVAQAQNLGPGDPLGALSKLDDALKQVAELNRKAAATLEQVRTAREVLERIDKAASSAAQRRAQGFLLREPGADPEPLLADARQHHADAWQAMNGAEDVAAGAFLSKALALADQAQQAIEAHVAARSRCEAELPRCRQEARRLADLQSAAQRHQAELARDFAPESWSAVADHLRQASTQLESAQGRLGEAAAKAAVEVQHYLLASRLLMEAAQNHQQAETLLVAIDKRLRELVETRASCRTRLAEISQRADRVRQTLQSSTADRIQANERFRTAAATLERLQSESRLPRPDWPRLAARLEEVKTELDQAEQLAREDRKLAQRASSEIADAERILQSARGFHESGVTADLANADRQLAEAQRRFQAQEYEEAIRLASLANSAALQAQRAASARAAQRRQELEAQRRVDDAAISAASGPQPALQAEAEPLPQSGPREF